MVGALGDEFGGGLAGGSPVQLVLDDLEELLGFRRIGLVVGGEREDVAHLEIHALLAGADVADAFEQFVEIVWHAGAGRVFQAFVVENEALEQVFLQPRSGPLAELGAAMGADAEADGEHDFQPIVTYLSLYGAFAFAANL